jgi:hypothetical protein
MAFAPYGFVLAKFEYMSIDQISNRTQGTSAYRKAERARAKRAAGYSKNTPESM